MIRFTCLILLWAASLPAETTVKVRSGSETLTLPLERYVAAVLAGEVGTFRSAEALKAMAVAARTYAVRLRGRHAAEGYDFCATTHCQRIELPSITPKLEDAAASTAGELLWFEGKPAYACYSRDCGGRTEDGASMWNTDVPYLKSHDDPYCGAEPWRWTANAQQVLAALRQSQLRAPGTLDRVEVIARSSSGRAQTLALEGAGGSIPISASSFRFAMGRALGWNSVRSERYQIHWPVFEGTGSGHGVGLCQRGADRMGATGRTYREILAFYFPGTVLGLTGRGLSWQRIAGERAALFTTLPARDGRILAAAEKELAQACARLRVPPLSGVEIRVYPDIDTFRNATGEPGWVAARTIGRHVELQPLTILEASGVLESTVRHEMIHVVMESQANPALPAWFREGLTGYLTGRLAAAFTTAAGANVRRAYQQDTALVADLVHRYGETAVLSWVAAGLPAEVSEARKIQEQRNSK